ncbi:MAG: hypothetical protein K0M63_08150 [Weeksellaceae bacterium]|nr:hypothetical protein [Weeksellaceae bacterium]
MKRKLLNLLTVASIITTFGYIMDGDPAESGMLTRFMEFFGMLGIVFFLVSFFYFSTTFVIKKMRPL